MLGLVRQMGIAGGSENGVMTEKFLHLEQIDTGLDQVGGIAVAKAVRRNLFLDRRPRPPGAGWSAHRHDPTAW